MLAPEEFTEMGSIMTTLVQLAVGLMDTDSWISVPSRLTDIHRPYF